jgi:cytochrome d ubiquinol oxidase subunit II
MLPEILAGIMLISLTIYAVMAGADFGGGVWDLFASGPRAEKQRELINKAIGPIWEANHVWLILVIVLMFTCFPPAFAAIAIALHIPLSLMLIGIVLRGSAFAFRSYDDGSHARQKNWGRIFAGASFYTPIMLGVCLGAATGGKILIRDGTVVGGFFHHWLVPFPWVVGLFVLSLFSFLAAIYLACEATDPDLNEDFRRRALRSGAAVGIAALLVIAMARSGAPQLWQGLVDHWWAWIIQPVTAFFAIGTFYLLLKRRYERARTFAIIQVVLIVLGWGAAEFPYLVRPELTIRSAAAPNHVLLLILIALAAGALILFPSLFYLYRVFKGRPKI